LIDLHLHTTASDGVYSPAALVERAFHAGITVLAITDHDSVEGLAEGRQAAAARRLEFVDGIEISAVEDGRDVHMLGYFFDPSDPTLRSFLLDQRLDRVRRVREIAVRLEKLCAAIDPSPLLREAGEGRSIGRPHLAAALLAAGHVGTREEAFDRFLGRGAPAFVPRQGPSAQEAVRLIASAGGVSVMAHPGLTSRDDLIPSLAGAGLDALEVYHADHDERAQDRYRALAAQHGLAVSGGSDFHGDSGHHRPAFGTATLPPDDFAALKARRR
jgi:predicted metal-dependent phosphoesterase TrpH